LPSTNTQVNSFWNLSDEEKFTKTLAPRANPIKKLRVNFLMNAPYKYAGMFVHGELVECSLIYVCPI
jgi:hypothetical protein